jgi:TonB family protein
MLALLLTLAPIAVSAESPATLEPNGPWGVDGVAGLCLLARSYDTPNGRLTIGFEPVPTQDEMEILLKYPAVGADYFRTGRATMTLYPDNVPVSAHYTSVLAEHGVRTLRFTVSRSVYDKMPEATALSISAGKNFRLALKNPTGAVAALQKCEALLLRHWGIDPVAMAAARTPPRIADVRKWFTPATYPKDARAARIGGRVVSVLSVNAQGMVEDCRVVVHSYPSLDRTTCAVAMQHRQIRPALDGAGQPVASWLILPVRWQNFGR